MNFYEGPDLAPGQILVAREHRHVRMLVRVVAPVTAAQINAAQAHVLDYLWEVGVGYLHVLAAQGLVELTSGHTIDMAGIAEELDDPEPLDHAKVIAHYVEVARDYLEEFVRPAA